MSSAVPKCLFDQWEATSAGPYHTSELWPVFDDASIQRFLAGNDSQPVPSRPLDRDKILETKAKITRFLESIGHHPDGHYVCEAAYRSFEQERLAGLDVMLAADDPVRCGALNDRLFGQLSDMHQDQVVAYLKHHVQVLQPASQAVAEARSKLLGLWSEVAASTELEQQFTSINHYIQQLRPLVKLKYGFVEELLAPYAGQETVPAEVARTVVHSSIGRVLGRDDTGWTAQLRDGAPNVYVDHASRAVVIPAGRFFTPEHVRTLIIHEIGVHVARAINGASSQERLAGYGMAGYGSTEEAFGVLLENAPKDEPYLAVFSLLVFGSLDLAGRLETPTFRDVYELNYALVLGFLNPDETKFRRQQSNYRERAFSRTIRVLRLGTTQLIDRTMTKYWYGQLLLNRYLQSRGLSEPIFNEFFLGKYDCNSPEQLELIRHHRLG